MAPHADRATSGSFEFLLRVGNKLSECDKCFGCCGRDCCGCVRVVRLVAIVGVCLDDVNCWY
ncbi:hypothetical protein V7S43_014390 [Phytophthora oleae]|uniref:Uncharacterized protein n=1 Tax=Phytophthora oleae TaxID=2107226 RepID=A0ABD3F3N8_9STRA